MRVSPVGGGVIPSSDQAGGGNPRSASAESFEVGGGKPVGPSQPDGSSSRDEAAAGILRAVEHPGALSLLGVTDTGLVLGEWTPSISLRELIRRLDAIGLDIEAATSVWLVREVVRTLVEVAPQLEPASPTMVHGALDLDRVFVDVEGKVWVADFGLTSVLGDPTCDALSCGLLLDGLLQVAPEGAPEASLVALSGWAVAQAPFETLQSMEVALETTFYRDLDGDEGRHGASSLADRVRWVALELTSSESGASDEAPLEVPPLADWDDLGAGSRVVVPQALTHADEPTGMATTATGDGRAASGEDAALGEDVPTDVPMPVTMSEPALAVPRVRRERWVLGLILFVAGFTAGLALLKLWRWLDRRRSASVPSSSPGDPDRESRPA